MKNLHNAYKKHMENQMSEENFNELKSRILCASREARVQQSTAATAAAHKNRPVYGHPALRRVTACVCALAVVCGAVLVSGMQNGSMPVQPSAAGTVAASHTNGNWFCLAVYAAGSDTKTVQAAGAKAIKNFDFYSQENIVEFGKHRAITDFVFSMKCDGKNIRELKYEISGKPTFAISGNPKREGYPYNPYDYLPKEKTFTSFTAKPGDDLSKYRIHCVAEITPEEDALLKSIKDGIRYTRKEAEEIKARANAGEDTSSELAYGKSMEEVREEMKRQGFDLFKPDDTGTGRSAASKGISGLTQDQGNKLEGQLTNVQGRLMNIDTNVINMANFLFRIFDPINRIAENTDRLEAIEGGIDEVKNGIEKIVREGIALKR